MTFRSRVSRFMAAVLALGLLSSLPAFAGTATPARVLVYGDSNTWGWMPVESGFPSWRFDAADRWPEVVRRRLAGRAEIVVDALNGRTVDIDHVSAVGRIAPEAFNGARGIASVVARELPLDLVVVMLGTNDVASDHWRSPERIAAGMVELVHTIRHIDGGVLTTYPAPRVLVVAPPTIGDVSRTPIGARFDAQSQQNSRALVSAYRTALAGMDGVSVVDAGEATGVIAGVDGIHLTALQQRNLGAVMAALIEQALLSHAVDAETVDRREHGLRALAQTTGADGDAVVGGLRESFPLLAEAIVDFAYGDVISRRVLDPGMRQVATVSSLAAQGALTPQLKLHYAGALNVGVSPEELAEVVYLTAVYAGFPRAINAASALDDVLRARGIGPQQEAHTP